jgi:hypothetical protein
MSLVNTFKGYDLDDMYSHWSGTLTRPHGVNIYWTCYRESVSFYERLHTGVRLDNNILPPF